MGVADTVVLAPAGSNLPIYRFGYSVTAFSLLAFHGPLKQRFTIV